MKTLSTLTFVLLGSCVFWSYSFLMARAGQALQHAMHVEEVLR